MNRKYIIAIAVTFAFASIFSLATIGQVLAQTPITPTCPVGSTWSGYACTINSVSLSLSSTPSVITQEIKGIPNSSLTTAAAVAYTFTLTNNSSNNLYVSSAVGTFINRTSTVPANNTSSTISAIEPIAAVAGDGTGYYVLQSGSPRTFTVSGMIQSSGGATASQRLSITSIQYGNTTAGTGSYITAGLTTLTAAIILTPTNPPVQVSPYITSIYPSSGSAGTRVILTGKFIGVNALQLTPAPTGGYHAMGASSPDGAHITFTIPSVYGLPVSSYSGNVAVTVSNTNGQISNSKNFIITQPSISPCYPFTRNLQIGSTGADVVALQTFLIGKGFSVSDLSLVGIRNKGYFGTSTASSTAKYQTSVGIPATGFFGPLTRAAVNRGCTTPPVVSGTQIVASLNPSSPATSIVQISTTAQTQNVPLAVFDVKSQGNNSTLRSLHFRLWTSANASSTYASNLFGNTHIQINGLTYAVQTISQNGNYFDAVFTNLNISLPADVNVPITVLLNVPADTSGLLNGVQVAANLTASAASVYADDVSYHQVPVNSAVITGSTLTLSGGTTPPTPICPIITVGSVTYTLNPCNINMTMVDGQGNKSFNAAIITNSSGLYGYMVYGYGVGFPTYGIIANTSSGGAVGTTSLSFYFNDSYLSANGNQSQTYTGYMPIYISQGNVSTNSSYLPLNVTLTVLPASSTQPSITVVSPNGAVTISIGQSMNVAWNSASPLQPVDVYILNSSNQVVLNQLNLIPSNANGQSIGFNTNLNGTSALPLGQYTAKVCSAGTSNCSVSNGTFTVIPSVTNVSPVISQVMPQPVSVGSLLTVYASNAGLQGNIILQTQDGSKTWTDGYATNNGAIPNGFAVYDGSKLSFTIPSTIGRGVNPGMWDEPTVPITTGTYNLYLGALDANNNFVKSNVASVQITSTVSNQPPVITGGTFPTTLQVNQTGTSTVNAYDPQKGSLSYSVIWGDENQAGTARSSSVASMTSQSTTFTHAYANPGTYTVKFTVQNSAGLSAQTSSTVQVMTPGVTPPTINSSNSYLGPQSSVTSNSSLFAAIWDAVKEYLNSL